MLVDRLVNPEVRTSAKKGVRGLRRTACDVTNTFHRPYFTQTQSSLLDRNSVQWLLYNLFLLDVDYLHQLPT